MIVSVRSRSISLEPTTSHVSLRTIRTPRRAGPIPVMTTPVAPGRTETVVPFQLELAGTNRTTTIAFDSFSTYTVYEGSPQPTRATTARVVASVARAVRR